MIVAGPDQTPIPHPYGPTPWSLARNVAWSSQTVAFITIGGTNGGAKKLSRQRQNVLELVRREGSVTPKRLSSVTGMSAGAARKLLYSMLSDVQLVSPKRGVYELLEEPSVTKEDDDTNHITGSVCTTEDVTEPEQSREETPILEDSPSGIWVYSVLDGGAIPREELRRRKGYSD